MSNPKIELLAEIADKAFKQTVQVADGVPAAQRMYQLKAGKGHPLWLLGHLTNTLNVVFNQWTMGGGNELPRSWGMKFAPDFAQGDPITTNAADYPSWEEVVENYKKLGKKTVEHIRSLRESDLDSKARGSMPEQFQGFFSSIGATIFIMTQHDAHHRGQIAMLGKLGD